VDGGGARCSSLNDGATGEVSRGSARSSLDDGPTREVSGRREDTRRCAGRKDKERKDKGKKRKGKQKIKKRIKGKKKKKKKERRALWTFHTVRLGEYVLPNVFLKQIQPPTESALPSQPQPEPCQTHPMPTILLSNALACFAKKAKQCARRTA
jgi:hypothetical protein